MVDPKYILKFQAATGFVVVLEYGNLEGLEANQKKIEEARAHRKWQEHYTMRTRNFEFQYTIDPEVMRGYADLHMHSKFSRATSRDLDLEHNAAWAARKGISVLGTGDFTHPTWFAELKSPRRNTVSTVSAESEPAANSNPASSIHPFRMNPSK